MHSDLSPNPDINRDPTASDIDGSEVSNRRAKIARLLDHEYDGIREYDNPTPGWWHAIFIATILFSLLYFAFYHFSPMSFTIHDNWNKAKVAENKRIFGKIGDLAADEATINKMSKDDAMMSIAKGMFVGNCASCHANDGGGINGVNLCDDNYKNVKKIEDIHKVIELGANNGAMPPWNARLSQNERVLLAAFVKNLRGTKPGVPKAAEGAVIPPW